MTNTQFRALLCALWALPAQAQLAASTPYTPSWPVRHQLQWLVDQAGLALPLTHWPLPAAAVSQALANLPANLSTPELEAARTKVLRELQQRQQQGSVRLQWRERAEGLTGFGENYSPGSSSQAVSSEKRLEAGAVSLAGRWGVRLEESSNALAPSAAGWGTEGRYQARLEGSAAVLGWAGWNVQAFSHQHWWGPGWQSSLVNGANTPAWNGVGMQRGTVQPSNSPWLRWMGPWNLDVFVARAQDPQVVARQPVGYLFSGVRLTLQPQPWLEVGLSRGMQTAGAGRPAGLKNFVKAFFGQEVNQNPGDPPDTSNQLAGFDLRVRCPQAWGSCAAYTQWMGEDAAGKAPLPYKFMRLLGLETALGQGRYRVFAEYADTNAYDAPGYTNGYYTQGYTNGGRWIGSAQGGGSQVTTLGWMDAQSQRMVKLHTGTVLWSVGSGYPHANASAAHGTLRGLSASQTLHWQGLHLTPELSWTQLSGGPDSATTPLKNLRLGLTLQIPL